MSDRRRTAIVMGDGAMAAKCVEQLARHEMFNVPLIVYHDGLATWTSSLEKDAESLGVKGLRTDPAGCACSPILHQAEFEVVSQSSQLG